jgi:signal transduction histidine kinase
MSNDEFRTLVFWIIRHSSFVIRHLEIVMKRPWQVWLVFMLCVIGAGAAMVWLTRQALRADELRRAAEAETELEQQVSLALWRMDTALAPIIAEEVIRPPSAYQSNGTRMEPPEYVLLQFEARPDGRWQSPQAGNALADARCEQLSDSVEVPALLLSCPTAPLPSIAQLEQNYRAQNQAQSAQVFNQLQSELNLFEGNTSVEQSPKPQTTGPAPQQAFVGKGKIAKEVDFAQRGARYQSAAQKGLVSQERANSPDPNPSQSQQQVDAPIANASAPITNEQVGVSRPVWFGDKLLLARRVNMNEESVVQGCWLDWPRLKARLLSEAIETLPDADLVPATDEAAADPGRMLAGLPVRLMVGPASVNGMAGALSPTLRWALWMGWGALALATGAAAALLAGVIGLSERRAAFVSSVTHELRTPLTTFRMYAEMLARGMVPDAARRQEYFNTLQREAERLTLLVENVLAYARLERGRKPQGQDRITLKSLLERVGPRLAQRAAQADMKCDLQLEVHAAEQEFTTDQSVVEQILFNLVDNAAKYAREAENRQIHVVASRNGEWIKLVVRDHGPGIEQRPWGRGSRAFGKSAQQSAETAHGVGLGLALCRRLARQLGGRLEIDGANGGGAAVSLLLPTSHG